MPGKYIGNVYGKFGNSSKINDCIIKDQFARRQLKANMEGNDHPDLVSPSQAFAAFGGSLRKRNVPGDDCTKPKEAAKKSAVPKKKTTFTWQPANQDKTVKAKDVDDDSKENVSTTDDIVCDTTSVDGARKDTSNLDEQQKDVVETSEMSNQQDITQEAVDQDHSASKDSTCSQMDEENTTPSVPKEDEVDVGVDDKDVCGEDGSPSSPHDGLDANANPEEITDNVEKEEETPEEVAEPRSAEEKADCDTVEKADTEISEKNKVEEVTKDATVAEEAPAEIPEGEANVETSAEKVEDTSVEKTEETSVEETKETSADKTKKASADKTEETSEEKAEEKTGAEETITDETDVQIPSPPPTPPFDTKIEDAAEPWTEEQGPRTETEDQDAEVEIMQGVKEDTEAPPRPSPPAPPVQQPPVHQQNHQNGPDLRHDVHNSMQQQSAPPSQPPVPEPQAAVPRPPPGPPGPPAPPAAPAPPPVPTTGPPQPPSPQNSAPPAPPGAPPAPPGPPGPPGPPAPPGPPGGAGGPPPPPPPPPPPGPGGAGGGGGSGGGNDLAAQLAAAKLKKATPKPDNGDDPPPNRPKGAPTGINMMADLQRKLKLRKEKAEGGDGSSSPPTTNAASNNRISPPDKTSNPVPKNTTKPWEKKITNGAGSASPRTQRRPSINSRENGSGDNVDFDRMKQEIMVEMRKEINKMKEDIIEAIKMELNRR